MFTAEDIESRSIPVTESGCHLWTGSPGANGYGQIKRFQRVYAAHRVAYEVFNGPIPTGHCVMHKCDTPRCVNPKHLTTGTFADNHADMDRKRRRRPPFSGRVFQDFKRRKVKVRWTLPFDEVKKIRLEEGTCIEVAKKYGISQSYVSMIRTLKVRINK